MPQIPSSGRDPLREPSASRLPVGAHGRDEAIRAHDAALAAGRAGYLDPATGLFVMSAAALLARGSCCRCGCRHCPYIR